MNYDAYDMAVKCGNTHKKFVYGRTFYRFVAANRIKDNWAMRHHSEIRKMIRNLILIGKMEDV